MSASVERPWVMYVLYVVAGVAFGGFVLLGLGFLGVSIVSAGFDFFTGLTEAERKGLLATVWAVAGTGWFLVLAFAILRIADAIKQIAESLGKISNTLDSLNRRRGTW